MNEALVKDGEDNVDAGKTGKNQDWLMGERILKGVRCALKCGVNGVGHTDFTASCLDVLDGRPKRSARSKIEGNRDSQENALVVDGERGVGRLVVGEGAEWNKFAHYEPSNTALTVNH